MTTTTKLRLMVFGSIAALMLLAWAVPSYAAPEPPFDTVTMTLVCPKGQVRIGKNHCGRRTHDEDQDDYWQPDTLDRFLVNSEPSGGAPHAIQPEPCPVPGMEGTASPEFVEFCARLQRSKIK